MTLGEKLKQARTNANLSQEMLAKKLNVSRSAIAKWENDLGMPDIDNLKNISNLLNVSIDFLLDENHKISFNETKEKINIFDYKKSDKCRNIYDAVCISKFKDATKINILVRNKILNKSQWLIDFITFAGIVNIIDKLNDNAHYYLVENNNRHYLVNISKEYITTKELTNKITTKKFTLDKYKYIVGLSII